MSVDINDDELESLMAELEAASPAPKAATPATAVVMDEPAPKAEPEPAPAPAPEPEPSVTKVTVVKPKLVVAEVAPPVPEPEPSPAPAPAPVPEPAAPARQPVIDPEDNPATGSPLDYYVDVAQFRKDTAVSDSNLDKCMMEQAGLRAYYLSQAALAEKQYNRVKTRFDVLEAKLYDKHRKALAAAGEKATEKMIESSVRQDPLWAKGKGLLSEAESIAQINRGLAVALGDRKDMLVQLGADRRTDQQGQLRVMERAQQQESLAERAAAAARAALGGR